MRFRNIFLLLIATLIASTSYARWFQDKEIFETESFGQVVFSHDIHLEAVGSNCEACHNKIYNIVTKKNPTYTMADMQKGKSCGTCHDGKQAFSVDKDCMSCHSGDVTWENDNIGITRFSHSIHLDMEYSCDKCHPDLFKAKKNGQKMSMDAMGKGKYCGVCHDGDTAFSVKEECTSCHAGNLKWENKDAGETRFSHSAHLEKDFFCDQCHPVLFKPKHKGQEMTMDAMSEGKFCGACHDGGSAFSVEEDCESCHISE